MAKLRKIFQLVTLLIFILLPVITFSQSKYSIDNEKNMKSQKTKHYRPSREEKVVMKIEKAQQKKEKKKERKDRRLHKKAVKKHNKKINGSDNDLVGGKKTYRRMRKSKREARKNTKR